MLVAVLVAMIGQPTVIRKPTVVGGVSYPNVCSTLQLNTPLAQTYNGHYKLTSKTTGSDGKPTYKCADCSNGRVAYLYYAKKYKFWALGPGSLLLQRVGPYMLSCLQPSVAHRCTWY